ncbi:MAG: adenosine deaminase, partial [Lachnospiraceae bacterium]|nr:adenosine deaminase [Lachnospiraceae bacterium]
MTYFTYFFLDKEKDIIVNLYKDLEKLSFELETPNHHSGNLIRNLAKLCGLPLCTKENGMLVIRGEVPCYIDGSNSEVYVFMLGNVKAAEVYPDGTVKQEAFIPAISKTLMSQTRDYSLELGKTIFRSYIPKELKFRSDLHTHMNGNLAPDVMIALGIRHQIRYPLYYVKKLGLKLSALQESIVLQQREKVAKQFVNSGLAGKYLARKIDDETFINFADLILNNLDNAEENIVKIRGSLSVLKDGQAVFTNLEKVYLYRYVFAKGRESEEKIEIHSVSAIPDEDVKKTLERMLRDSETREYRENTIFQDKLLWIARGYKAQGVSYVEIADTTLVKKYESVQMLTEVHEIMPKIYRETGVMIRFLAAIRRIPLTIVKDRITPADYITKILEVLKAVAIDPYVAGCDFVGEEITDIITLKPVFKEIAKIAAEDPTFVIRIHAGENDSTKDNIAHSIECVKDGLAKGQKMPVVRLGHGLYTYGFRSEKGKRVLKELKENNIVLEFQITSNVRQNNLNSLEGHPLKAYLRNGIACVQGTDGAAMYGTSPIDEQLTLMNLLDLSYDDLKKMKEAESAVIEQGQAAYSAKKYRLKKLQGDRDLEEFLLSRMTPADSAVTLKGVKKLDAEFELKDMIEELPWDLTPVIVMGGSFNTDKRATKVTQEGTEQLDRLMESLDPSEVC